MNGAKWMTIAGFSALLSAIALNGKEALEAIAGLPAVLQAFSAALPFGVVSTFLALAITTLAWYHLSKRRFGDSHLDVDLITLLIGVTLTFSQTLVGWPKGAGEILQSILVGILVGLLAPLLAKIITALAAKVMVQ